MCIEFDRFLDDLQKRNGAGAIRDFARRLGVDRVTLWRIRKGVRKPGMRLRIRIERLTLKAVKREHFI
jgi:transcriptional regulator with XRE-family HTH domain